MMKQSTLKLFSLFCLSAALWTANAVYSAESESLPVKIKPDNPKIRYVGRFDVRQPNPRCSWPGSSIIVKFSGTAINALLSDTSKGEVHKEGGLNTDYMNAVIDNGQPMVFPLEKGRSVYRLGEKLSSGEHTLLLFKRTESFVGAVEFRGLEISEGGNLLDPPAPSVRRIEFIGDSITCGYGNESESEKTHFNPLTENNYLAYGAMTARHFGAEYVCIAWSGIGAYSSRGDTKNIMAVRYDKILPFDPSSKWDFKKWIPGVVVMNLGTNDFAKGDPGENFVSCYADLLKTVRGNYPDAQIFCVLGPLMWGDNLNKYRDYIKAAMAKLEDGKICFVEFAPQDKNKDGLGGDWHPSLNTHGIMAAVLIKAIEGNTDWKAAGK